MHRRVLAIAALAAVLLTTVVLVYAGSKPGAAATLTSSDGHTSLSTIGTVTSGTPYSSGQQVTVSVAANSVMDTTNLSNAGAPTTGNFYIEECADPGATIANLPTTYQGCEAATMTTALKSTDGSMSLTGANAFTIYDLPDLATLGVPTMVGTCDTAPNQCVIGIFADNPNFGHAGFSYPHLFSAPFNVDGRLERRRDQPRRRLGSGAARPPRPPTRP